MAPVSESVLINDGGLATELEARGHDLSDPLWSARLLADDPREIVAVHAAYFRAGATIGGRDDVLPAIEIASAIGKPVIVYPNSGERWDGGGWAGPRTFSARRVTQWVAAGARIVGGCCRVGPADIADVRRACARREKSSDDSQ